MFPCSISLNRLVFQYSTEEKVFHFSLYRFVSVQEGAICLHSAASQGHVAVIKALLSRGVAVDSKTKVN